MNFDYITSDEVCSSAIHLDITDGTINNVKFDGGCPGNTKGIERLISGMKAEDAVKKLKGIKCGLKTTSCPDQLAQAIENFIADKSEKEKKAAGPPKK